jgi:hypothetical protein
MMPSLMPTMPYSSFSATRQMRPMSRARCRVPGKSVQLLPISTARAMSRRCVDGSSGPRRPQGRDNQGTEGPRRYPAGQVSSSRDIPGLSTAICDTRRGSEDAFANWPSSSPPVSSTASSNGQRTSPRHSARAFPREIIEIIKHRKDTNGLDEPDAIVIELGREILGARKVAPAH